MKQDNTLLGRIFNARLLRTKHDSNTKRHVLGQLSCRDLDLSNDALFGADILVDVEQSSFKIGPGGVLSCVIYGTYLWAK